MLVTAENHSQGRLHQGCIPQTHSMERGCIDNASPSRISCEVPGRKRSVSKEVARKNKERSSCSPQKIHGEVLVFLRPLIVKRDTQCGPLQTGQVMLWRWHIGSTMRPSK